MPPPTASVLMALAALWLLTDAGNRACRLLFSLTGLRDAVAGLPPAAHSAGRVIGWLERLILAAAILTESWEVLAAVIALKTIGRFKELDDKLFAEYFLVGSLFSLLWALVVTAAWLACDRAFGIGLAAAVRSLVAPG